MEALKEAQGRVEELLNQLLRLEDEVTQQRTEKEELLKQVKREEARLPPVSGITCS